MAQLFQLSDGNQACPIKDYDFTDEVSDLEPFIKENIHILGE